MRRDRPALFQQACDLENLLNTRRTALGKDPVWLTHFNRPLAHAVRVAQDMLAAGPGGVHDAELPPARPVPVLADPWPGVLVRGRGALAKADACGVPIAEGLTPHGLRHTYKTLMIELGTPATLMDAQMGHEGGSVQARYSHITAGMTQRLLDGLTELWAGALAARRQCNPRSPVAVLDRLLGEGTE